LSKVSSAILQLFREQGGFVSGEIISRELNVSRTAIWKHINTLRKAGYIIEAIPSRGYHMVSAPDVLIAEEITAQMESGVVGKLIICHAETSSTNTDAFRLAEQGAEEGTVVLADSQSSGKGRLGRVWSSPQGVNLYASIILRPSVMPYEAAQLTFLSAVAVARSIELVAGLKPEIKWPNDVLICGKKIAGLLNEMSSETDRVNFVILGIGVNLNMSSEQFPPDLRQPATSLLLELGRPVQRTRFAAVMLSELDRLYADFLTKGFGPVREEWQQRCNAAGRTIEVSDAGTATQCGMFAGIDSDGALLMRRSDGSVDRIISGDVRVI
jgi:BirA family biotin operon repressor/biotin-[acetyl-CoA-carboxylase] ligase